MTVNEFDRQRWAKGDTIILESGEICDVNGVNFFKRLVYGYNRELHKCFSYGFEEIISHDEHTTPTENNLKQFKESCRQKLGLKGQGIDEAAMKLNSIRTKLSCLYPMLESVEKTIEKYRLSLESGIEELKS